MYKAAIFDLDGTLANTIDTICYYGNRALEKFHLSNIDKEKYKYLVGEGYEVLIKKMLIEKNAYSENLFSEMKKFYHDDYEKDSMYLTSAYHGITLQLKILKDKKIKLGVLTNKPHGAATDVVNTLFGKNIFDYVFGQKEDIPLKPNPTQLNSMIDLMGVSKDECLYFGDTNIDMRTGINAKVKTVGVLWGFRKKDELLSENPDYIIENPEEITSLFSL